MVRESTPDGRSPAPAPQSGAATDVTGQGEERGTDAPARALAEADAAGRIPRLRRTLLWVCLP
jgi:hypothetical protein